MILRYTNDLVRLADLRVNTLETVSILFVADVSTDELAIDAEGKLIQIPLYIHQL